MPITDFQGFVQQVVDELNRMIADDKKQTPFHQLPAIGFEKLVVIATQTIINTHKLNATVFYKAGGYHFPDVVIQDEMNQKFGIEVKTSQNPSVVLGNSILGTRRIDVLATFVIHMHIYNGKVVFKSARYEDVVADVVVTHSPRYKLDLNQNPKDSFFAKSGLSYAAINKADDPIGMIAQYYQSKGLTGWWLAQSSPVVIKDLQELDKSKRDEILMTAFVLFPEILSATVVKYQKLAKWLVIKHSVTSPNLRDYFSAGGKINITLNNQTFCKLPRIFATLYKVFDLFIPTITNLAAAELQNHWCGYDLHHDSNFYRINYWIALVTKIIKKPNQIAFIQALLKEVNIP